MSFVEWARNVIVLGPSGVGKTDLAIALANKAVEAGYSVLFLTLEELIGRLVRAAKESRLERSLQQLTYPKVLIIDEIGYPAAVQLRGQSVHPQQQELPGLGRGVQRPGAGHTHPGSAAALLDHAQHQGGELPARGETP